MSQRIIFRNEIGGASIIVPSPEALERYTIFEIAAKDVPVGTPYQIVDAEQIPTDRTFRKAWTLE